MDPIPCSKCTRMRTREDGNCADTCDELIRWIERRELQEVRDEIRADRQVDRESGRRQE